MNDSHDSVFTALLKPFLWVAAWIGTVQLADVQMIVSIVSGCIVGLLAMVNLYVTWRDKIRRRK